MQGRDTNAHRQGAAPPDAVAVGIVFALDVEAEPFAARVAGKVCLRTAAGLVVHTGAIAGRTVAWVVGGVGAEPARRAARLLIDGHRPRLLVSAGFAGGLDPACERGGLVAVDRALRCGGTSYDLTVPWPPSIPRRAIVTVDEPVADPLAKRALAGATGAALVDMETHAVAAAACSSGVPCAGVRVVSDGVDDRLPPEVIRLSRPQSAWRRMGAAVGAVGRRPGAAFDLWRLWEHAVVDGRLLARGLDQLTGALPEL